VRSWLLLDFDKNKFSYTRLKTVHHLR